MSQGSIEQASGSDELPMTQEHRGDATGLASVHVNRTIKGFGKGWAHRYFFGGNSLSTSLTSCSMTAWRVCGTIGTGAMPCQIERLVCVS